MFKNLPPVRDTKSIVAVVLIAAGVLVVMASIGGWIFRLVVAAAGLAAIWVGVKLLWPGSKKSDDHPGGGGNVGR